MTLAAGFATRRALLLVVVLAGAPAAACRADTAAGLADFRAGRFAEALQAWETQADAGDATAALLVGVMNDTGEGVAQNEAAALRWYRRAAAAGSAAAMFNVGVMFDAGRGVAPDRAAAAQWYQRAATAGIGRADYNLALMYEAGDGVPRDRARAIALFRAAAAHGIRAARDHLAQLGRPFAGRSEAGPEDVALRDFQAAEHDLLTRGAADAARAAALFRSAAERHNALAEYDLGYCYENGIGLPVDKRQAYAWYSRAAEDARAGDLKMIAQSGAHALEQQFTNLQQPR